MLGRALSTLGLGFLAVSYVSLTNTYRFKITRHTAELPGLTRPLRIVQLSDLHYGMFVGAGTVRRWVSAALHAKPDVIVITGDILDSSLNVRRHPKLMTELARLRAPLGVYGVWGNHDWTSLNTSATRARFAERLRVSGVRLINNAGVQLRDDVYLAGVDDWWFGEQHLDVALSGHQGGAVVLLSHNPDYLAHVPERVNLTLSGHTHGGQVRLPGIGPLKRKTLTPVLHGWMRGHAFVTSPYEGMAIQQSHKPGLGFVSRGLGVTGVPLRLNCPAELVVFDLLPPPQEVSE